jgi:hypothetical protein
MSTIDPAISEARPGNDSSLCSMQGVPARPIRTLGVRVRRAFEGSRCGGEVCLEPLAWSELCRLSPSIARERSLQASVTGLHVR